MIARRFGSLLALGTVAVLVAGSLARAQTPAPDPWPSLANDVFKGRALADGTGLIAIDLPYRAEDAAMVPIAVRATLPPGDGRRVKAFTIVIDENPAPVAATFEIGPNAGVSSISTRVRVDSYTNVHAVAELSDGKLYVVKSYVKASGGCSAPAGTNADEAKVSTGSSGSGSSGSPARRPSAGCARPRSRSAIRTIPACRWIR